MDQQTPQQPQQPQQPQRRRIPNLMGFLDSPPPAGMKINRQYVEKREIRKTIMITKTLNEDIELLSDFYDLSINSTIIAILNRYIGQYKPTILSEMREQEGEKDGH